MLELRVLGGLAIERDGVPLDAAGAQRKGMAALAVLAVSGDCGVSRARLVGLLWGERDEDAARRTLAQALYQLRRTLGEEALTVGTAELRLNPDVVTSDIEAFEAALARKDRHAAAAVYRGPFLDGVHVPGAPEFARWVETVRAGIARRFGRSVEELAQEATAAGDAAHAVQWWRRAAGVDPLSSRVALGLINALAASGDTAGAIRQGELYQALWREELDAEPEPAFAARLVALRAGGPASSLDAAATQPTTAPLVAGPPAVPAPLAGPTPLAGPAPLAVPAPSSVLTPPTAESAIPPHTPVRRRPTPWRRRVLAGVALTIAVGTGGVLTAHHAQVRSPPRPRVLVAAFDNATGDSTLDPIGRMAAGWITERLGETGLVRVVDARTAVFASRDAARLPGPAPSGVERLHALAAATDADVVVWGTYYRTGDSLRVETQVADAKDGHVLQAVVPVSAPVAAPFAAIERAREAVTGAVATLYNPRMSDFIRQSRTPPTYEAYREAIAGWDLLAARKFAESAAHMRHAFALDSTYPQPLIIAAFDYEAMLQRAAADSMIAVVHAQSERLSTADQDLVAIASAWVHGENDAAVAAAHALQEHAPGPEADMLVGISALRARRLRESADVLARSNPERGWMRGWENLPGYRMIAYHILGEPAAAVAVAEDGVRRFPGSPTTEVNLVIAYVGAGRVDDAVRTAIAAEGLPDDPELDAGDVLWDGARELRAHGHAREGDMLAERALAWYQARPAARRAMPLGRVVVARALYRAKHWAAADSAFQALARDGIGDVVTMAYLGALAARRGDRTAAARWDDSLAAIHLPYAQGLPAAARARIAALLGDRDCATALYRQAQAEGLVFVLGDHADMDFASVRTYPPFAALLRSRD